MMEKFLNPLKRNMTIQNQRRENSVKRSVVAFGVFSLCSICLMVAAVPVNAAAAGYVHTTWLLANPVTLDGKWTSSSEWIDTDITGFGVGQPAVFRSKWGMDPTILQYICVEFLTDNTNDAGDYWQFCFDGDMSGGTAPQVGDMRIDIVGHTNITAYTGTGTGWSAISAPSTFTWSNSMDSSPTYPPASSTPHWICEISIDKQNFVINAEYWLRIAVYDASNQTAGVQAWPPTSRDVPNDWGDIPYQFANIPEGIGLGSVVALSSVVLLVGSFCFRKRQVKIAVH